MRSRRVVRQIFLLLTGLALRDIASCDSSQPAFRKQARQYLQTALLYSGPFPADDGSRFPCAADEVPYELAQLTPLLVRLFESADDFAGAEGLIFQSLHNSARICGLPPLDAPCDCADTYEGCVLLAAKACVCGAIDFAARLLDAATELWEAAYALHHRDHYEPWEPLWPDPARFWSLDLWGPMLRAYLPRDERMNQFRDHLARHAGQIHSGIEPVAQGMLEFAEAALAVNDLVARQSHAYFAWLSMTAVYQVLPMGPDVRQVWQYLGDRDIGTFTTRPSTSFLMRVKDYLPQWRQNSGQLTWHNISETLDDIETTPIDDIDFLCGRALDVLIDNDFLTAASAFRELGQKIVNPAYATCIDWNFNEGWPFPESVIRAAWPPIFRILEDDCRAQFASSRRTSSIAWAGSSRVTRPKGCGILPSGARGTAVVDTRGSRVVFAAGEGESAEERFSKLLGVESRAAREARLNEELRAAEAKRADGYGSFGGESRTAWSCDGSDNLDSNSA